MGQVDRITDAEVGRMFRITTVLSIHLRPKKVYHCLVDCALDNGFWVMFQFPTGYVGRCFVKNHIIRALPHLNLFEDEEIDFYTVMGNQVTDITEITRETLSDFPDCKLKFPD